ncbi:hypothetical protein Pfo_008848 [Paulownia fortunei]|nr:hypothetical protein Pfo_008848 [Paulownia fortunei]
MASWGVSEQGWRKGPWTPEEDKLLVEYVSQHGEGRWSCASKYAGLNRSGKSCRLRWVNYLRPGLKKGHITPQEEGIIIELHALWGNKWSTIARYLPGRTDNEIKNYWRTHFKKRKPSQNQQEKRKLLEQKQQQAGKDNKNIKASPDQAAEAKSDWKNGKQETDLEYPNIENHQIFPMIYQDSAGWSDFIPVDNYLWGGLWNLDDQNGCSKMAIQNQANLANYSCGGDVVNYMHSEGCIF